MRKNMGLLFKLILGIVAGILLGSLSTFFGDSALYNGFVRLFVTFTGLFSNFLSFIIPLIIISFVSVGMADLGKRANKLFVITLVLAYCSTILAGIAAFAVGKITLHSVVNVIDNADIAEKAFEPFFTVEMTPIFGVMTALVLAFLLGIGMANIKGNSLLEGFRDLQEIVKGTINKIVIPLIPFYIAGMFCKIGAEGKLVATIKMFVALFFLIIILQYAYIFVQYTIASIICRKNHIKKIKNAMPTYFTALGTQSSASTIPVALNCAVRNGVKPEVADFCIPLCATIHLAGDTICLVLGTMGIMVAEGIEPTIAMFTPYIFLLGITMVAAPGVPGGGVMAALGLINDLLGFTQPMQQLIISLHLSQDSFGTSTNVMGDQALALIVDKFDDYISKKDKHKK